MVKLHFEEENHSKKQESSALTSSLEATALSCVMAKRTNERDSARKILLISQNFVESFRLGCSGHQAMVKYENRRKRNDDSIDKFLDDLEILKRRSNPDKRISERNLAISSKSMDVVKSDELTTMLATHLPCELTLYTCPMTYA